VARVLWVSTETPSRDGQGGQRRQFHQIKGLLARGHEITVLVPRNDQSDASIRELVPVLRPRLHILGWFSRRWVERMRRTIASPSWDAIVLSHDEPVWLLPDVLRTPVLLDLHNVMSHWHRAADRTEAAEAARRLEARALARADAVMTCSAIETRRLAEIHPEVADRSFTAPLGVDPAEWSAQRFARDEARVVLFGSWAWHPNRLGLEWFVQEVWPLVVARVPEARALVAGTGVDDASTWPSGARFVGRVDGLADFAASATVVAVPVREGVGASVKFAEALASGASVVATTDGANAFDDPPAFVSDDADAWAEWIAERLNARGKEPAPAPARAIALDRMTWHAAVAPIDDWLRAHSAGRTASEPISS
jgi:glycosyltransferase involved in cell wall biosynthesis